MNDLFGTSRLRENVLAAWTASPARFREDANAEEDFALGGYRDRLIVELAQNAADAALRAGVPGRLRLTLRDGVLEAANTGGALDATGVEGLSTLRVSGKRDEAGAAGRFGVGFAAVVSVSDEPAIASRATGGVRWSRALTSELVAGIPSLEGELAGREGHVPLLRLPFPAELTVPEGFDSIVRLPLRDAAAEDAVRRMLEETSPALPLVMPALSAIDIEVDGVWRSVTAAGWHVVEASGEFTPEQVGDLFADRPTEERARPFWQVRWAVPIAGAVTHGQARAWGDQARRAGEALPLPKDVPSSVHAPTPSDEPLDLPALLIATFPLATDRRHVAAGPLTEFLVRRSAEVYCDLLRSLPRTPRLLDLVPQVLAKGELDAAIRGEILALLPDLPLLPAISAPEEPTGRYAEVVNARRVADGLPPVSLAEEEELVIAGRDARVVAGPGEFLTMVAEMVPGLLPSGWPVRHHALPGLNIRRIELADVIDMLSGDAVRDRTPAWWRALYSVIPADDLEAVGAVAVPLADGRLVRGARGTLVMTDGDKALDASLLAPLGLRIVHPDAAHPLLLRLGAAEATPRTVLDDPLTHAAVTESAGSADPEPVAQAVLALVEAAGLSAGEAPWLATLALRGADGEVYAAGDLLLEGGDLARLIDQEAPFAAPDLVEKFGSRVLAAAGVLDGFAVVNDADVVLDPDDCDHDLDREDEWLDAVLDLLPELDVPPVAREFTAVRDLEYVADWAAALPLLARPPLRAALQPLRVVAGGDVHEVPSYTAWWLAHHPVIDGKEPTALRLASADPLLFGLYADAPPVADEAALTMIGVRSTLADLLASHGGPEELLDLMADASRTVDRAQLRALWKALAEVAPDRVSPPSAVRAVLNGEIVVADVDGELEPVVVEAPDLLALVADRPLVLVGFDQAEALSEVLDLPLVGEVVTGDVTSSGADAPVPPQVHRLLPGAPPSYTRHEELLVDGRPVPWRFFEGRVHASGVEGLARGLAWAAGQWGDRLAVEALLRDPERVPLLLAEADLDG